jgi:hypothetical protein
MSTPTKSEFAWLNVASLPPEELHDEVVWGTIKKMGWIAGPELFFALKQYVRDIGLVDGGVREQADGDDADASRHAPAQHSGRHSAR